MATTTNLNLTLSDLGAANTLPMYMFNRGLRDLDTSLAGQLSYDFTSDADVILDYADSLFFNIILTDTGVLLTTTRNVEIDSVVNNLYYVTNNTAQIMTFEGFSLSVNESRLLYINNDSSTTTDVDLDINEKYVLSNYAHIPGKPVAGAVVYTHATGFRSRITRDTKAVTSVIATATADFDLKINGVSVALISFGTSSDTAINTISTTGIPIQPTDKITIEAPNPQDTTLSDVGINLFTILEI